MAALAARLRLPPSIQDVLLAALVVYFQIRGTQLVAPEGDLHRLDEAGHLGYVLLLVSGVALVVRRRWPAPVFVAVAVVNAAYYAVGYPDGPTWVALFVALYTMVAAGDGERSLRIAVAAIAALTLVWLSTADLVPLNAAGWVFFRIGAAIMAAALGESVRSRRVNAEQAEERAALVERTREDDARRRVDAERLRIAREVHDTVAHAITVINVQAGVAAHILDRRPQQVREAMTAIEATSARALNDLRTTLSVLREGEDRPHAPAPGLAQLEDLAGMARESGLDVKVEVSGQRRPLPTAADQAAYRILQESITNAVRHAGPTRVTISLEYVPGELRIRVDDEGPREPRVTAGTGGGQGIPGMRERCLLLGGDLTAAPRAGGGFAVRARIPLVPVEATPAVPS